MNAIWTITILKGDPVTQKLTLDPPTGDLDVTGGDIINWVIGPNSGVSAIIGIEEKPGPNHDVFNPDPAQLPNSTSWQGKVREDFTAEADEHYSILWSNATPYWLNHNPPVFKHDPVIRVQPKVS